MRAMSVSLVTLAFTIVIGYAIAFIIWGLPRLLNLLDRKKEPRR